MNKLVVVALSFVAAACGGASLQLADEASGTARPIINGDPCDAEQFPSAVAILVDAVINLNGMGTMPMKTVVCTGTLIAADTVLTAAHCVDETALTMGFGTLENATYYVTSEPDLTALAQQSTQDFPDDAILAASWVQHPEFTMDAFNQTVNGPGNYKDIALIFLTSPMPRTPMHVIGDGEAVELSNGVEVDIAGWGQQEPGSGNPFEPPPAGSVGRKICAHSNVNELGTHEMQIGSDAQSERKCHGDSGGPTYLTVSGGGLRVVGVTSHAYDQEDCNKGGVDTRVDVWRAWIDAQMRSGCTGGTRVWCDVPGVPPEDYVFPVFVADAGMTPDAWVEVDAGTDNNDGGDEDAGPSTGGGGDVPKDDPRAFGPCSDSRAPFDSAPAGLMLAIVVAAVRRRRG